MQAELEALSGKAAKGVLYRVAFRSGCRAAEGLRQLAAKTNPAAGPAAIIPRLADLAQAAGHGFSEVTIVDLAERDITWVMPASSSPSSTRQARTPCATTTRDFSQGSCPRSSARP